MLTSRPAPTPTESVEIPSAPATSFIVVVLVAWTVIDWPLGTIVPSWFTCALAPMYACVLMWETLTTTAPAMPTPPELAPPARATDDTGMETAPIFGRVSDG